MEQCRWYPKSAPGFLSNPKFNSLHPSLINNWYSPLWARSWCHIQAAESCEHTLEELYPQKSHFTQPLLWDQPRSSLGRDDALPRQEFCCLLRRHHGTLCAEICHWQQSRGSGAGAICPWETKLPGLPKPGAKSQCSIFPGQTCCFIYFHPMNTNTANPLKHKWLPTPYLQFMFIPTLLDNFCSFSSLLLHSLVKNSKALNQSQKFNLKFHVDPALKEHVSSFRARMITKSIHLFPFPSPELSLAACESEV